MSTTYRLVAPLGTRNLANVYAVATTSAGLVVVAASPGAPEAYTPSRWAAYSIPLAEGPPGVYSAAIPAGAGDDNYGFSAYQRAGGTPATTDATVGSGNSTPPPPTVVESYAAGLDPATQIFGETTANYAASAVGTFGRQMYDNFGYQPTGVVAATSIALDSADPQHAADLAGWTVGTLAGPYATIASSAAGVQVLTAAGWQNGTPASPAAYFLVAPGAAESAAGNVTQIGGLPVAVPGSGAITFGAVVGTYTGGPVASVIAPVATTLTNIYLDGGTVVSIPAPTAFTFSASGPNLTATQSGAYIGSTVIFQATAALGRVHRVVTGHAVAGGTPIRHDFTVITANGTLPVIGPAAGDTFLFG